MTYLETTLPKHLGRLDDRDIVLSIHDEGILLESDANEHYDYECTALSKEQAIYLATRILSTYEEE